MYGDAPVEVTVYDMGNVPPIELGLAGQVIVWMIVLLLGVCVAAAIKFIYEQAFKKQLQMPKVKA